MKKVQGREEYKIIKDLGEETMKHALKKMERNRKFERDD